MLASIHGKKLIVSIATALLVVAGLLACLFLLPGSNPSQKILAGQDIVVTVSADALEDMYGYQFRLSYDKEVLEFKGSLKSKISDIQTIFSKPMEGYELVGATMIGERAGVSGKNKAVCEMVFTVKQDSLLADCAIALRDVNVVKSDMAYLEGIEGWKCKTSVS